MTERTYFRHVHPADGEISLATTEDGYVKLACRWPFDLSTDDFITFTNRFGRDDIERLFAELVVHDRAEAQGVVAGKIELVRVPEGYQLIATNAGTGELRKALHSFLPMRAFGTAA